jgi:hypothetical protein
MEELDVTQVAEDRGTGGGNVPSDPAPSDQSESDQARLRAILEAIVYVTDEPLSAQQMAAALGHPLDKI